MPAALEHLLAPGYLDDLEARPTTDIRAMRAECHEVETGLSLLRRVVQGHLDIVDVELDRRTGGGEPGDHGELLARLPEVLADRVQAPGPGRLPTLLAPEALDPGLEAELAALVGGAVLDPSGRDEAELRRLADGLRAFEAKVSGHRRDAVRAGSTPSRPSSPAGIAPATRTVDTLLS